MVSSNMLNDLRDWVEEKERKIESLTIDLESLEIEHSDLIKLIKEIRDWFADLRHIDEHRVGDYLDVSSDEAGDWETKISNKLMELGER